MPAWVVLLARRPALREGLKLGVALLRQNDLEDDVLVAAGSVGARDALSPKSQASAGVGAPWYGQAHLAGRRRQFDLGPEHRFVQRDGNLQFDVVAMALEQGVRTH